MCHWLVLCTLLMVSTCRASCPDTATTLAPQLLQLHTALSRALTAQSANLLAGRLLGDTEVAARQVLQVVDSDESGSVSRSELIQALHHRRRHRIIAPTHTYRVVAARPCGARFLSQ